MSCLASGRFLSQLETCARVNQKGRRNIMAEKKNSVQKNSGKNSGARGKPNILFIMSDDIGWFNISCNNNGIMGYRTPNIDRIANEGANFTDFYGQQSCTAGRAA